MNIIEDILVEEALRNAELSEQLFKVRTNMLKDYGNMDETTQDTIDIFDESLYAEQTEDGYVGFAPLG